MGLKSWGRSSGQAGAKRAQLPKSAAGVSKTLSSSAQAQGRVGGQRKEGWNPEAREGGGRRREGGGLK